MGTINSVFLFAPLPPPPPHLSHTAVEAYMQVMNLLDANSTNKKQKGRMNALLQEWGPQYNI